MEESLVISLRALTMVLVCILTWSLSFLAWAQFSAVEEVFSVQHFKIITDITDIGTGAIYKCR
jgi:hypothetical protein